jgi:NTE family protein
VRSALRRQPASHSTTESGAVFADIHTDWIAGISIGAINAAIIAGNPPNSRVDRLREFWTQVTLDAPFTDLMNSDHTRNFLNQVNTSFAAVFGANGFFSARPLAPWLQTGGTLAATSIYDTSALKTTLERLVDFDRINAGMTRFSAGAVNVRTGNLVYFDTATHTIRPEHILASGALPPGFPAVEIDGEHYWDGGLVSNTPLQWLIECGARQDTLVFQVDLWGARGQIPRNMAEVVTRQKEIQYSSRTRASTDQFKSLHRLQRELAALLSRLPEDLREQEDVRLLRTAASHNVHSLVHLIFRNRVAKMKLVEQLTLVTLQTAHHGSTSPRIASAQRNHGSWPASTDFCNKIGTKRTSRREPSMSAVRG